MLRSCVLEWTCNWDDYICLVEFAYNNNWHASIKCAPFEMLYGRKCRAPICWDQVKIEHQRASGLLQQLDIPVWKWDEISMDFVTGLPQTQRRHDSIWVVVDRLTKSAHFLPIRKDYSVSRLAEIFQQEIVRLYGTSSAIVSDRDPRFASRFWKGLQKAW
nr:retrotransposable element Tf2 [Tanacetum cinerariifolium]